MPQFDYSYQTGASHRYTEKKRELLANESPKPFAYEIRVASEQVQNPIHSYYRFRYWAYDVAQNCCLSPVDGRLNETEARLDAMLNAKAIEKTCGQCDNYTIDPVLKAKVQGV